jgi:hypothetical protein
MCASCFARDVHPRIPSSSLSAREAKASAHGKKAGGKPPAPPLAGPGASDQINLTDADSRIMPVAGLSNATTRKPR